MCLECEYSVVFCVDLLHLRHGSGVEIYVQEAYSEVSWLYILSISKSPRLRMADGDAFTIGIAAEVMSIQIAVTTINLSRAS